MGRVAFCVLKYRIKIINFFKIIYMTAKELQNQNGSFRQNWLLYESDIPVEEITHFSTGELLSVKEITNSTLKEEVERVIRQRLYFSDDEDHNSDYFRI